MVSDPQPLTSVTERALWPWWVLLFCAVALYFYGLSSPYAPTNGDEMVYIHIARLTAASGHWLPLVSDLDHMRNTKPPLLFWQAIASGDWSAQGTLFSVRWPSVAYTLLSAAAVGWMTLRMGAQWRSAAVAVIAYLAFFSTYRYGRAYLTSAPETFWLALPMWYLLFQQSAAAPSDGPRHSQNDHRSTWAFGTYTVCGALMGVGLLYKSFALIAPAAATLACALWLSQTPPKLRGLLRVGLGVSWAALVALGVFALWFAVDPDPAAIWQEFVIGENAGKLQASEGYWHAALAGDNPLWLQALAYPENAGLLLPVALGLCLYGLRAGWRGHWRAWLGKPQGTLLVWLIVWLLVFCIPSQRSARYLIPAMPAFAILLALHWERLGRGWFALTLAIAALALGMLARIAWVMHDMGIAEDGNLWTTLLFAGMGLSACAAGMLKPIWTRHATLPACLALYACFTAMTAPLSGAQGGYDSQVKARIHGMRIAVPSGFNAQYERFEFLLPGNTLVPYAAKNSDGAAPDSDMAPAQRLDSLLHNHDAVVWLEPDVANGQVSCLPRCVVLGQRWHVKSRHRTGEVHLSNLWRPQEWLFGKEQLIVPAP